LEAFAMEDVGVFYGHLVYFMAIWYIFWPFSIINGHLVYFLLFWYVLQRKSGNPELNLSEFLCTTFAPVQNQTKKPERVLQNIGLSNLNSFSCAPFIHNLS
jgi:hypothetical protein